MAAPGSKKVVIAALIGNFLISISKFGASAYTGSSAMLSEAIHSLVDTVNQALMLFGLKQSTKSADAQHPFGYGREVYFWAFVVAMLIFGVGAGVAIYEGIEKLKHPTPVTNYAVNYMVLGAAFIFEAGAWWVAFKEFKRQKGSGGYFKAVRASKDPTVFTVLFEDSAAMAGIIVAFVGIALVQATGMAWLDGAASILIGMILAAVAGFLSFECKGLLIGESASQQVIDGIRALVNSYAGQASVNELLTMHLGPQDVLVNISLDFADSLSSVDVERLVSELEQRIKANHKDVTRVFIEAQSFAGHNRMKRL
ncbi:MAG: cation diffusion facilitator family transporter [Rhodospirillales bacterium]